MNDADQEFYAFSYTNSIYIDFGEIIVPLLLCLYLWVRSGNRSTWLSERRNVFVDYVITKLLIQLTFLVKKESILIMKEKSENIYIYRFPPWIVIRKLFAGCANKIWKHFIVSMKRLVNNNNAWFD